MLLISSVLTDILHITITTMIRKKKWQLFQNWLINKCSEKYITPLVNALSVYDSNIIMPTINNKTESDITDNIFDICNKLLISNKFWIKKCLDKKYVCIDELIYNFQTIYYKDGTTCLVELFQQAWDNIFQYFSLNQDILNNHTNNKVFNNICEKVKTFNIRLPRYCQYNASDNKEALKQCYILAHKQFVNNNINQLIHYSHDIIVDWCISNKSEYPYYANIYSHLLVKHDNEEVFKDILKIYLSNNIDIDIGRLNKITEKYDYCLNSKEKSVLKSLQLIKDKEMLAWII